MLRLFELERLTGQPCRYRILEDHINHIYILCINLSWLVEQGTTCLGHNPFLPVLGREVSVRSGAEAHEPDFEPCADAKGTT